MDVLTLHALRRGKNHTHRIIEPGSVISLSGAELDKVLSNLSGREATRQEVAGAKAGGTYFDGSVVTSVTSKAADASTSTSTTPAPETKVKPFDKMTKAELEQALTDGEFTAPEGWADMKNGEKADWLQKATEKAAADKADAEKAAGGAGGGADDDLTV